MTRVRPYPICVGDRTFMIRGVDDWLVFATDEQGRWFHWVTECVPQWSRIGKLAERFCNNPTEQHHRTLFTPEHTLAVGVMMARDGIEPARGNSEFDTDNDKHFRNAVETAAS